MPAQKHLKQQHGGPLHSETAVGGFKETVRKWLTWENINNAKWIRPLWPGLILRNCVSKVEEVRKNGRRDNMEPATGLRERAGQTAKGNVPPLRNTNAT